MTGNCFLTAANKDDTQCFWDKHKKFTSTVGRTIKCEAPKPASEYKAVCVQNQCGVEVLSPVAPKPEAKTDPLTPPTITPNLPPFYTDSKWQFADYAAPAIETLGPDYKVGDKPFIAFDTRGEMWGHDGTIWFHRTYTFDDESITFSTNLNRCEAGKCFDMKKDLPTANNQTGQTRFLGRYELRYEEGFLAFGNANEKVKLKRFVPEASLPPLPKDLPLCEIRDMKQGEIFPDYRPAVFDDIGYRVIGSDQTLYWDHHVGPQGYVELGDGQEVLFDGPDGFKILRRLTPYNTTASFGPQGLYCVSGGYDRHWPPFMKADQFDVPDTALATYANMHVTKLVVGNSCVQIEDIEGNRYSPIFSTNNDVGYDDFGFYFKRGGRSYRIGDEINFDLKSVTISKSAFKGFARNSCPEPLILLQE